MSQDGTNFGNRHVQGAIASFHSFVAMTEKDHFGSVLGWVRGVKRVALPLVHGPNKISKDVKRKNGTVHTPVTPEALAMIVYFTVEIYRAHDDFQSLCRDTDVVV